MDTPHKMILFLLLLAIIDSTIFVPEVNKGATECEHLIKINLIGKKVSLFEN